MEICLYSIPAAAKVCLVSRQTMWRWVKSGELKGFLTPGGNYRIRKEDLESFVKKKMKYLPAVDSLMQKKILVVDDDPNVSKLLHRILSENGYRVERAMDGFEAGIKTVQFEPDLIILALFISGMDGFEVCRRIKDNPKTSHIKILAHTGHDSRDNKNRIMKAGADGYMVKPVSKRELIRNIENEVHPDAS